MLSGSITRFSRRTIRRTPFRIQLSRRRAAVRVSIRGLSSELSLGSEMLRFTSFAIAVSFLAGLAVAQQPSGTSVSPAPGTHMEQSTVQTVGSTSNGAGATVTTPRPSPDAGTALPTLNAGDALVSPAPRPVTQTIGGGGLAD